MCIRLRHCLGTGEGPGSETSFDDMNENPTSGNRMTPEVDRPGEGCFPEETASEPRPHKQARVR